MADAVRNTILASLETRLSTIATADGYSQTVRTVARVNPNEAVAKADPQPAIYIYAGEERQSIVGDAAGHAAVGEQWNQLVVNVIFLAPARSDQEQVGTEFLADVVYALVGADGGERIVGSTPVTVRALGNLVLPSVPDADQAGGHAQFAVGYPTRLGDPRTGVA